MPRRKLWATYESDGVRSRLYEDGCVLFLDEEGYGILLSKQVAVDVSKMIQSKEKGGTQE